MNVLKPDQKRSILLASERALQKAFLDQLVTQYKTADYIPGDPISIPYRYVDHPKACELTAFLAALFSYGRRDIIIPSLDNLLQRMAYDPLGFVEGWKPARDAKAFKGFVYRFNKAADLVFLMDRLNRVYREYDSLEQLFTAANTNCGGDTLQEKTGRFLDAMIGAPYADNSLPGYGLKFLLAHPANGGACKRMNMFFRWMVRQDAPHEPKVDFGLWRQALSPADLVIPLDTHVTRMNRHFGFTQRKTNTWRTAEEITAVFRRFCPEDPTRYDYALMGYSLSKAWKEAGP